MLKKKAKAPAKKEARQTKFYKKAIQIQNREIKKAKATIKKIEAITKKSFL